MVYASYGLWFMHRLYQPLTKSTRLVQFQHNLEKEMPETLICKLLTFKIDCLVAHIESSSDWFKLRAKAE